MPLHTRALSSGAAATERIAKYIARCGFASRREAERLVADGRVCVDGRQVYQMGDRVEPGSVVSIDGGHVIKPLRRPRLFLYHKPKSEVVSKVSPRPKDLKTVFDSIEHNRANRVLHLPRLVSVGRLDIATEGLLVMTSSPSLATLLEHPRNGHERVYLARVFGEINPDRLDALKNGITVNGVKYDPIRVEIRRERRRNSWLEIKLTEGKNREVRNALQWAGLAVNRLIRTSFGPFRLDTLPSGCLRELPVPNEMRVAMMK